MSDADGGSPRSNWTEFPFPTPFTLILMECSPKDLLSCRATCTTWYSWFSSSSTVWVKYYSTLCSNLPSPISYRLSKLMEVPVLGEGAALVLAFKIYRALKERQPVINPETMLLIGTMEKRVPVLAPPFVFIRLKVNHPVVTKIVQEVLDRHLGCILVDKSGVDTKDEVRMLVLRNMQQHQFAFINIVKHNPEPELDTSDSLVLEGEDRLEEALKLSMETADKAHGEKRKREGSENVDNKRIKIDSSEMGEEKCEEEENEDMHDEANQSLESIYSTEQTVSPDFPTILELLSIDQPLVKELLITKCQIDTSLVVPQFDEFLHHPGLLASDKLLVGCDSDGKVASVRPGTFSQDGGALLGFIENPMSSFRRGNKVEFWCGKDIRHRWPEFASQLDKIDKRNAPNAEKSKGNKLNLPVVVPTGSLTEKKNKEEEISNVAGEASSSSISSSVPDIMERLAARGVSVQRK